MGRIITISRKGCSIVLVLALLFSYLPAFFPSDRFSSCTVLR